MILLSQFAAGLMGSSSGVLPVNTVAPSASPTLGAIPFTGSCTTGTWTNVPTSYSYQWFRNGVAIGGATNSTLSISIAATYFCRVTATNSGGSSTADSNSIDAGSVPVNTIAPTAAEISSHVLQVDVGTWSGAPTSYQMDWYLNSPAPTYVGSGQTIGVSGNPDYVYYCVVTAINSYGSSAQAFSNGVFSP